MVHNYLNEHPARSFGSLKKFIQHLNFSVISMGKTGKIISVTVFDTFCYGNDHFW